MSGTGNWLARREETEWKSVWILLSFPGTWRLDLSQMNDSLRQACRVQKMVWVGFGKTLYGGPLFFLPHGDKERGSGLALISLGTVLISAGLAHVRILKLRT